MKSWVGILAAGVGVIVIALLYSTIAGKIPGVAAVYDVTPTTIVNCLNDANDAALIQSAITSSTAGDIIGIDGTCQITSIINISKQLTIDGGTTALLQASSVIPTGSGGSKPVFEIYAAGTTIQNLKIEKTDKSIGGDQNLIYVAANNVTIKNNEIWGKFVLATDGGQVSRALITASGAYTGLVMEGNNMHDLRQPAYFNPTTTGTIKNNNVYNTKGFVVVNNNLIFTGNTWGTGAQKNVWDIALLSTNAVGLYPDIRALSDANNGAQIEDQRGTKKATVQYADPAGNDANDGSWAGPKKTIQAAVNKVVTKSTVYVAPGTYPGFSIRTLTPGRDGMTVVSTTQGGAKIVSPMGECYGVWVESGDKITIDGFDIQANYPGSTNGCDVSGLAVSKASNITIKNNIIHDVLATGTKTCSGSYGVTGIAANAIGPAGSVSVIEGNRFYNINDIGCTPGTNINPWSNAVQVIFASGSGDNANHGTGSILIKDNIIESAKGFSPVGIRVKRSTDFRIIGNTISGLVNSDGTATYPSATIGFGPQGKDATLRLSPSVGIVSGNTINANYAAVFDTTNNLLIKDNNINADLNLAVFAFANGNDICKNNFTGSQVSILATSTTNTGNKFPGAVSPNIPCAECGNNVIEGSEVCDGGSQSCVADNGYDGTEACNSGCSGYDTCQAIQSCGDNVINGNEGCDAGLLNGNECSPAYGESCNYCGSDCQSVTVPIAEYCGDNNKNGPEQCDGETNVACTVSGYDGVKDCNADCNYTSCVAQQSCGDGVIQTAAGEQCDKTNLGGATCDSLGFDGGILSCSGNCGTDTSACYNVQTTKEGITFPVSSVKQASEKLVKAQSALTKSLNDKYWQDATHLTCRYGKKAFEYEKKAVEEALKAPAKDPSVTAAVNDAVAKIVGVDNKLAQIVLDQAISQVGASNKDVVKAIEQMNKAALDLTKGDPQKAIESYRDAWKKAMHALGLDNNDVEDCDYDVNLDVID